jgi:hypothetical protein
MVASVNKGGEKIKQLLHMSAVGYSSCFIDVVPNLFQDFKRQPDGPRVLLRVRLWHSSVFSFQLNHPNK